MPERFTHPAYVSEPRPEGGRLSTLGHGDAFRAFCRAALRMRLRFLVIGGTYTDVRVRRRTTRDIDVVLVDRDSLSPDVMESEGFRPVQGSRFAWRYVHAEEPVEIQIAAIASSRGGEGPFSVALSHAEKATIEGRRVLVPRIEDHAILKLLAMEDDPRRTYVDLGDIQISIEAYPELREGRLSVPAIRARLRDLYGISGGRLRDLTARYRTVWRLSRTRPAENT